MKTGAWGMLALAGAGGIVLGAAGARAADQAGVARGDRAGIEAVVHDYILAHPEIIPEAMERLQQRKVASAISGERKTLLSPFAGAWAGNPQGDVTLVMFTDYNCIYCRASAPDIDRLLASDPKLKVVWREIPVLGPQSVEAAHAALAAAKQGHYLAFHRALFAGGRPDQARLVAVAKASGTDPARMAAERDGADVKQELESNIALAMKLGVTGTPAFVVGDQMLSGAVGYDALAKAVADARKAG